MQSHQTLDTSKIQHFRNSSQSTYSSTPVYLFYLLASILGHQIKLGQGNILKLNTVLAGKTATRDSIVYWFRECQNLGYKQQDGHYHLTAWCTHQLKTYKKNIYKKQLSIETNASIIPAKE